MESIIHIVEIVSGIMIGVGLCNLIDIFAKWILRVRKIK